MNKRDKKRRKDLIRTRRRAITRKRVKKKPKDRPGKSHLPAGGVPQDVRRSPEVLAAPKDFRLLHNTEECVNFFKKVRSRNNAVMNYDDNVDLPF